MRVLRTTVGALARHYGPFIQGLPAELNGPMLLWAIAGNESSFGDRTNARHEIEYCPQKHMHGPDHAGQYVERIGRHSLSSPRQIELYHDFGCTGCCSFTPWQIMAVNALGFTPIELLEDLDKGAEAVVSFLNRILASQHHFDGIGLSGWLEVIARLWNGPAVTVQYMDDLKKHYTVPME
jgi:hypothetical protein